MHRNPFVPRFDRLPATIPIFPLSGAVVMPGTQLPLNIFESRYLEMVQDSLRESRMIGMIQPKQDTKGQDTVLFRTGCAGRITSFSETDDGRYIIVLTGVCRFNVSEELSTTRGYRRVVADWEPFALDYEDEVGGVVDRKRLTELLRAYAGAKGAEVSWERFAKADDIVLVNVLIANLPFDVADQQSLIEAVSLADRTRLLEALLELSIADSGSVGGVKH